MVKDPFAVDNTEEFDLTMNDHVLFHNDQFDQSTPPSFVEALDIMDISDRDTSTFHHHLAPKKDYTSVPLTGSFITAACPRTGKPLYFSKKTQGESKRKMETLFKEIISKKGHSRGLLIKPIWRLRNEIEEKNREELKRMNK
jgi:hypothetical protein